MRSGSLECLRTYFSYALAASRRLGRLIFFRQRRCKSKPPEICLGVIRVGCDGLLERLRRLPGHDPERQIFATLEGGEGRAVRSSRSPSSCSDTSAGVAQLQETRRKLSPLCSLLPPAFLTNNRPGQSERDSASMTSFVHVNLCSEIALRQEYLRQIRRRVNGQRSSPISPNKPARVITARLLCYK